MRSRVHMFAVATRRLEEDGANPALVKDFKKLVRAEADRRHEGRTWNEEEERRVDAQRSAFNAVGTSQQKDALKNAMLQRAYDLMWDGLCTEADAILEFLPSLDAEALLDAWSNDNAQHGPPKSKWYGR